MAKIGNLSFGRRACETVDFKLFYCPLNKRAMKAHFRFFWWFGHKFYIALGK